MKVAFIGEGLLDDILIPPLITTIAKQYDISWPIDFSHDIKTNFMHSTGFGAVKEAVKKLVEALEKNPKLLQKVANHYIILIDGKQTEEAQREIKEIINGRNDFIFGLAIKELEAWILGDRDHVIEWLNIEKKDCPDCRFWLPGYRAEKDSDPKETLSQLVSNSDLSYDVWDSGAARDFVEKYWKNSYLPDERIMVEDWEGKIQLEQLRSQCPIGFSDFENQILKMLGK